ncbi:hypothetical protein BLX41_18275 [Pseudomonas protegens]|nr:hypothetical protein BLX41_18275 [Pseudomonas protegens]
MRRTHTIKQVPRRYFIIIICWVILTVLTDNSGYQTYPGFLWLIKGLNIKYMFQIPRQYKESVYRASVLKQGSKSIDRDFDYRNCNTFFIVINWHSKLRDPFSRDRRPSSVEPNYTLLLHFCWRNPLDRCFNSNDRLLNETLASFLADQLHLSLRQRRPTGKKMSVGRIDKYP